MRILISGCSFTAGDLVIHHPETGLIIDNEQPTWVEHLTRVFNADVNNVALGGNSNDKICRKAFEELYDPTDPGYDYVIIQWTALHRQERYSAMIKEWVNFCNTGKVKIDNPYSKVSDKITSLYDWHTDDAKYTDDTTANIGLERTFDLTNKAMTAELMYGKSIQDFRIEYFKTVLTMQQALQQRNIPYLFTSMANGTHIPTIARGGNIFDGFSVDDALCEYERELLKEIDMGRWTTVPMTHMMEGNQVSHDDSHPNPYGHKLIYKHIKTEFYNKGMKL